MFKKILIYGENWSGTLPRLLFDELSRRDYIVEIFDYADIVPGIKNRALAQKVRRRLFPAFYAKKVQRFFLAEVFQFSPHLIIICKGLHLNRKTLEQIRQKGIALVNWNPDDFFNMKNSSLGLIDTMPMYDVIVSSREHLFAKYRNYGAKALLYLDWYFVPELHYDHNVADKTITASFVGTWSPTREKFISELRMRFCIWGGGWEKSARSFRNNHLVNRRVLSQVEMSRIFGSSKYNLNLLTYENSDLSNLRFFEVPASAGLLLTERNVSSVRYLRDREECLMFSSSDEVNEIFSESLDLELICANGHRRIVNGVNAFSNRIDELMAFLKSQL